MRKVINVCQLSAPNELKVSYYVICNDGTVWIAQFIEERFEWRLSGLSNVPQDNIKQVKTEKKTRPPLDLPNF